MAQYGTVTIFRCTPSVLVLQYVHWARRLRGSQFDSIEISRRPTECQTRWDFGHKRREIRSTSRTQPANRPGAASKPTSAATGVARNSFLKWTPSQSVKRTFLYTAPISNGRVRTVCRELLYLDICSRPPLTVSRCTKRVSSCRVRPISRLAKATRLSSPRIEHSSSKLYSTKGTCHFPFKGLCASKRTCLLITAICSSGIHHLLFGERNTTLNKAYENGTKTLSIFQPTRKPIPTLLLIHSAVSVIETASPCCQSRKVRLALYAVRCPMANSSTHNMSFASCFHLTLCFLISTFFSRDFIEPNDESTATFWFPRTMGSSISLVLLYQGVYFLEGSTQVRRKSKAILLCSVWKTCVWTQLSARQWIYIEEILW